MKSPILALALGALCVAAQAHANEYATKMRAELATNISKWVESPIIVDAIKAQNAKTESYSQAEIDALDKSWRAEVGQAETPTITPVVDNAASRFLREQVAKSDGRIVEVFVMDARGLDVAASAPTSDYWQGDEAKFTNTYDKGAGAVDLGDVEFDESSQAYLAQISTTITDPATGKPIGAITVGLNVDALN